MNKLAALSFFSCATMWVSVAHATNTVGYVGIRELKVWDTKIHVHLVDNQTHECANRAEPYRFLLDPNKRQAVNLLYLARATSATVSLDYFCNADGHAEIAGIRVR